MSKITITPRSNGGITITGDDFETVVNGDHLEQAMFYQNSLPLPPDLVLTATRNYVTIHRPGKAYFCHRGHFVDVIRGMINKLDMEVFR